MNIKSEKKILAEFQKIMDDPAAAEKRFRRYAQIAWMLMFLVIFYLFSDSGSGGIVNTVLTFGAGVAFGLGIWFLQAGTQTGLMVRHMSRESIAGRLQEIDDS